MGGRYLSTSFCEQCYRELHGLPPTFSKMKQHLISSILTRTLSSLQIPVFLNRFISKGGKKLCPDLRFTFQFRTVIIEIDEHQHRGYAQEKEREELLRDFFPNLIIWRVNADRYKGYKPMATKHTSLVNGMELEEIIQYTGEIERRQEIIINDLQCLLLLLVSDPTVALPTYYLFYDEN
jgi:hypothetical protein